MALVEKQINVAYESSVQEVLSKMANVADKTTLDQILTTVTELKESGGSGVILPANTDTIRLALLSEDPHQNEWAFKQTMIGAVINDVFSLNSEELASCTSVEEIARSSTALSAISENSSAVDVCSKNDIISPALGLNYTEKILTSGQGYTKYNLGDKLQLNYGGEVRTFIVADKGYFTSNKIVLVSEDVLETGVTWGNNNNYSSSNLRSYLNSTVLSKFSPEIQSAIVASPVSCHNGNTATTCNDKIWALSGAELGFSDSRMYVEGRCLAVVEGNGLWEKEQSWWLRTPSSTSSVAWYSTRGSKSSGSVTNSLGVVCAFEI